jgi:hypothetical protein
MDDDAIVMRLRDHRPRFVVPLRFVGGRWQLGIGDTWYEFPEGTTREHVDKVFAEAKRRLFEMDKAD